MSAWSVVVHVDGEPVTGELPCDAWGAAGAFAPLVVGLLGGPVSVAKAVVDYETLHPDGELDLYGAVA